MSLVPPQETIVGILCVGGEVLVKLVTDLGRAWGEAG